MDDLIDVERTVGVLNEILKAELSGVVRYTHYSLVIMRPVSKHDSWPAPPQASSSPPTRFLLLATN